MGSNHPRPPLERGPWQTTASVSAAHACGPRPPRRSAPAYAMIGAAATLASVFRAPLTASLLLFELTRGYDIVLPLLAAAGTGPLVVEFARKGDGATPSPLAAAPPPPGAVAEACEIDNAIRCEEDAT